MNPIQGRTDAMWASSPIGSRLSRGLILLALSVMLAIGSLACERNILREFSKLDSDEALLFDARKALSSGNYEMALEKFALLSPAFAARRDVVAIRASAYAGRCGLDFLGLVVALGDMGSQRLFPFFMSTYVGAEIEDMEACLEAEDLLNSLGAVPEDRMVDENLLMVFMSFVKMGRVLSFFADTNDDGQMDPGFDACNIADFPDQAVAEVATGLANVLTSLAAAGTDIAGSQLTLITSICDQIDAINPNYNFCAITNRDNLTADHIRGVRTLVNEDQAIGLGSCTGDIVTCLCL